MMKHTKPKVKQDAKRPLRDYYLAQLAGSKSKFKSETLIRLAQTCNYM
ncbi:hypothetical protein ACWX0P_19630 [Vibrio mediterranei]